MSDGSIIAILFMVGAVVLFAELLLPSFGMLTAIAIGCFVGGIVLTFQAYGQAAGLLAAVSCVFGLPVCGVIAMRVWPKTWLGKMIIPPNPVLTDADTSVPVVELSKLVGKTGRSLSPLRPVGICEFDGHRISCVAESGLVDTGTVVQGVGVSGGILTVALKKV